MKFNAVELKIVPNFSLDFLLIGDELAAHLGSVTLLVLGTIS